MRVALTATIVAGALCCGGYPGLAYDVAPVSGGGAIKGKVTFNGAVPSRTVIPTKDENVCGGPRKEPLVHLSADKGVQDAVVALQGIAKGKSWPATGKTPTIDNKGCIFLPRLQVMQAGKMSVLNSDPVLHNTHGFYDKRTAFNLALPNLGQSIEVELQRPGTVRIECDSHGWMLGWVYVVDNPYYALTDEAGGFEIKDVPPGKYSVVANQEHTGPLTVDVEVKAGETVNLPIELKK